MTSNVQAMAEYIPAAWRAYQHLGEIRDLQARALPHIQALMALMPQAQRLYAEIFPETQQAQAHSGTHPPKMSGISVSQLQEMLNHFGAHLKVDGIYGENTKKAVENYQRGQGLTVDGWAGSETLDHLFGRVSHEAAAHTHSMVAPGPGTPAAEAAAQGAKT